MLSSGAAVVKRSLRRRDPQEYGGAGCSTTCASPHRMVLGPEGFDLARQLAAQADSVILISTYAAEEFADLIAAS